MTEINSVSFAEKLVQTTRITYSTVSAGLSVYGVWKSTDVEGATEKSKPSLVKEGFVDDENLAKLLQGDLDVEHFEPIKSDRERKFNPILLSSEGREYVRQHGNPVYPKNWEALSEKGMLRFSGKGNPWVHVVQSGFGLDDLHFISLNEHSVVDRSGRPIPMAFMFEYGDSRLSNDNYDLDKVCALLADNPEVEIVPDRYGNKIQSIPSFNRSEESTHCLELKWVPSDKNWDKFLEGVAVDATGRKQTRFRPWELLNEHDVLGLQAGGCRTDNQMSPAF